MDQNLPLKTVKITKKKFHEWLKAKTERSTRLTCTVLSGTLFGCVFTTILTVTPYIPFYMYDLPKRHMMCVYFGNFTGLLFIIGLVWQFSPGSRLFLFGCKKLIFFYVDKFGLCLFWNSPPEIYTRILWIYMYTFKKCIYTFKKCNWKINSVLE